MFYIFRYFIIGLICIGLSTSSFAAVNQITEEDGDPSMFPWKLKVTNNTFTNNGDGTGSLNVTDIGDKYVVCQTFTAAGINACIDALGADGGEVYLPEGTYDCEDATITIDQNNTTLTGSGKGTILDFSAGQDTTTGAIDTNDKTDIIIQNLQILGAAGGGDTEDLIGDGDDADNLTVQNCWLIDGDDAGINTAGDNVVIVNNYFNNMDANSIDVTGDNSLVEGNTIIGGAQGIHAITGSRPRILGNYLEGTATNAIITESPQSIIDDNTLNACSFNLIVLSPAHYSTISNNNIDGSAAAFNDLKVTADYCNITGNTCKGSGTTNQGIWLDEADFCVVEGNITLDHDVAGIQVDADCDSNSVGGNNAQDTTPYINNGTNGEFFVLDDLRLNNGNIRSDTGIIDIDDEDFTTTGDVDIGGTGIGKLYATDGTRIARLCDGTFGAYFWDGTYEAYLVWPGGNQAARFSDGSGIRYARFCDGTYAAHFNGTVTFGTDGDIVSWGEQEDTKITFTGTQFQIQSDVVTATDGLLLRGGTNGIAFNIGATEEMLLNATTLDVKSNNINTTGSISDGALTIYNGAITGLASLNGTGTINLEDHLDGTGFTITGEQLTSTDDITYAGLLTDVMWATDDTAILIDGQTNDYTGSGTGALKNVFLVARDMNVNGVHPQQLNIYAVATATRHTSAVLTANHTIQVGDLSFTNVGNWTQSTATDKTVNIRANATGFNDSGVWDATGAGAIRLNKTAFFADINDASTFTQTGGGTHRLTYRGLDVDIDVLPTLSSGALLQNVDGAYFDVRGNDEGTSTGRAIYIAAVLNFDTCYSIYDASGCNSVYDGDDQKIIVGEGQDFEYFFDGDYGRLDATGDAIRIGDVNTVAFAIEGDADTYWVGSGSGLAYGCIQGFDETVATEEDTWVQVTFDTVGVENLMTGSAANNDITIDVTGIYKIGVTICGHTANAHDFEFMVKANNGTVDKGPHLFQTTAVAGKVENTSGQCIVSFTATDTAELWVLCSDADGIDFIFNHVDINFVMIGG